MRTRTVVGTLLLAVVATTAQADVTQAAGPPEHGFITNTMRLPLTNTEARELGRDVDGDGDRDNQLGSIFATMGSQGVDLGATVSDAIVSGDVVMLHAVRTFSFVNSSNATWQVWYGAPTPDPDFSGAGEFDLLAGQPHSKRLPATIKDHKVKTAAGTVPLRIDLGTGPVLFSMKKAVIFATCTKTACTAGRIAGALTSQQVDAKLIPAWAEMMQAIVDQDCPGPGPESCADGSTGKSLVNIFDANEDLVITATELRENSLIQSLLAPDLDLFKANGDPGKDGVKESVSLGLGFTTVKATLTRP